MTTGLLAAPAVAADAPGATLGPRGEAVAAWKTGGKALRAAAEQVLVGSDAQIQAFLDTGRRIATEEDERLAVLKLLNSSGPGVRQAAQTALA
ncbi:ALF repeat-containing protein [Kitasatospora arboriphila]